MDKSQGTHREKETRLRAKSYANSTFWIKEIWIDLEKLERKVGRFIGKDKVSKLKMGKQSQLKDG